MQWNNLSFILSSLVLRDFKVRYRNMSLGFLWSLANPIIMMVIYWYVFTLIFPNPDIKSYPIFFLCGIIPFNFFSLAWIAGTTSIYSNAALVKRVPMNRELLPISVVLANCIHLGIQIVLLLAFILACGYRPTIHWLWVPILLAAEIVFVCGLALLFSCFDVYLRDTRYIVESLALILFWLTPVLYPLTFVPANLRVIYVPNPISTVIVGLRAALLDGHPPPHELLMPSFLSCVLTLGLGLAVFGHYKKHFADHL